MASKNKEDNTKKKKSNGATLGIYEPVLEKYSKDNRNIDFQPIFPLHPALKDSKITVGQAHSIALACGLPPGIVISFLQGKLKPDPIIKYILCRIIDDDIVEEICNDFDPTRFYLIYDKAPETSSDYFIPIIKNYPLEYLEPVDAIATTDGRWLIVSHVRRTKKRINVYSGGVLVFSARREGICMCRPYGSRDTAQAHKEILNVFDEEIAGEAGKYLEDATSGEIARRNSIIEEMMLGEKGLKALGYSEDGMPLSFQGSQDLYGSIIPEEMKVTDEGEDD